MQMLHCCSDIELRADQSASSPPVSDTVHVGSAAAVPGGTAAPPGTAAPGTAVPDTIEPGLTGSLTTVPATTTRSVCAMVMESTSRAERDARHR